MRPTTVAGLVFLSLTLPAAAQRPLADASTFPRPKLAADADTNSWLAYYNYGVEHLPASPGEAEAGFVWASRIDPSRAEPLFGRWVSYWHRNAAVYYWLLHGDRSVMDLNLIKQVDSLAMRAAERDPLFRRENEVVLYEQLAAGPGSWDSFKRAFLTYASGKYDEAARRFSDVVREDSVGRYWVRYYIALCHAARRRYDSAAVQISLLLGEINNRRSEGGFNPAYTSHEELLYALGALHLTLGDTTTATADLGQSLTENLSFHPAHALLGDIEQARGDSTHALEEYALAIDIDPADGVLRYRYARILADVGRLPEAEAELRRAIALEPFYAPSYLALALVLDTRGNRAEALQQYRAYLQRTYRADPRIALAQERITALSR